ncbi:DUF2939 domain-containing protein [Acinetobacter sp. ANC 4648]|uniref:DUF2939 domain-containing protein n=1 Tax=Acinetobacter sp. ANC 4648 TaxID=1977875 RepID=UPI000A335620|nr:DUF2939 domain-containing protein [Acinetobacter sp. ANC 4648]OTG83920.1 hypothetical protein B9T27_05325 [Acinetobacter sp. ANC 4648]
MHKVKIGISIGVVVCLVMFFASPYWMLYQINQAIKHNQASEISKYIDFPSVRASLKPQVDTLFRQKIGIEHIDHPLAIYATRLTSQLSEQIVDTAVTPQSIALLMQGKQLKESIELPKLDRYQWAYNLIFQQKNPQQIIHSDVLSPESLHAQAETTPAQYQAHYVSLSTFEVVVPTVDAKKTRFIFRRYGMHWKLVKIDLSEVLLNF